MEFSLAGLWLAIIGFFLLYYAVSDGFGLGVGILCLFSGKHDDRKVMMESVGYIWHTNQTWLVVVVGMLFGAFPIFYSILFSALYVPAVLMLVGLIFRGVSIDFHEHSRRKRLWAASFGAGSLVAATAQGLLLGGLLSGIHVRDGHFAGGVWDWANPLSFLVGLGVVAGYVLLGCNYLILKTEGDLQKRVFAYARIFFTVMLVLSIVALLWINMRYPYAAKKWRLSPDAFYLVLAVFLTALAFFMLFRSLHKSQEAAPFFWNAVTVAFSFVTLSLSMYPHMIPHVVSPITVHQAAASYRTLIFMLVVTGILIPVIVFYTTYTHRVFRGKVKTEE